MDRPYQLSCRSHSLAIVLAILVLTISAGCGPPKEPMGLLTGSVMSKGEVCGDCQIALYEPTDMRSIGAAVDASGNFRLEDIPFGEYRVMVLQKPTNDQVEVFDQRIPKRYRETSTSGFRVSIKTPEEVVLNLEMD